MYLIFLVLCSLEVIGSLGNQEPVNTAIDKLLVETRKILSQKGWTKVVVGPISQEFVVLAQGTLLLARFKASEGSVEDLTSLARSGDTVVSFQKDDIHIIFPITFGQMKIRYNQYSFQYNHITYVGGFNTYINSTFGTVNLKINSSRTPSVGYASLETIGQLGTDIRGPPVLVSNMEKVKQFVAAAVLQSLPSLDDYLQRALSEGVRRIDIFSIVEKRGGGLNSN